MSETGTEATARPESPPYGRVAGSAGTLERSSLQVLADPARRLQLLLDLVALHSAVVGLGLIWHPADLLNRLGYAPVGEQFFPVQGGVFHVVMAIGYFLAARDLVRNRCLAAFAVVVKSAATVFLIAYWLLASRISVVLLSGIGDGVMAILLGAGYVSWRRDHARGAVK